MSLTIASQELQSESAGGVPPAVEVLTVTGPPTVERWLEVMYGIRPDARLRARFVPVTHHHEGDVARWLEAMWGIRPGRQLPHFGQSAESTPGAVTSGPTPTQNRHEFVRWVFSG